MNKHKEQEKLKAAALGYNPEVDIAPRLLAKGQDGIAKQIVALARKHDVPLYTDSTLVTALLRLELDSEIPPELYQAVAGVLAFVYQLDQDDGKSGR